MDELEQVPPLPGQVIQGNRWFYAEWYNSNLIIPPDDSVPQITEGKNYYNDAWIKCVQNDPLIQLSIQATFSCYPSATWCSMAVFRNNGPDAIAARALYLDAVAGPKVIMITHYDKPGSGGVHYYDVRFGTHSASLVIETNGESYIAGNHHFGAAQPGINILIRELVNS